MYVAVQVRLGEYFLTIPIVYPESAPAIRLGIYVWLSNRYIGKWDFSDGLWDGKRVISQW